MAGQLFQRIPGLLRLHQLHHFDLFKLVLPNHAAGILAVGTGFRAKTGRVAGQPQRQRLRIQYLSARKVRYRHLGRWYQVIPGLGIDTEKIFLELGQLPGTAQAVAVGDVRHVDFRVAVLPRMQVQHELGQCTVQPRQLTTHDNET